MLRRHDDAIGEEIVDEGCARRARITKVARLERCRPVREDAHAGARRMTLQVDGNIDLELAQPARCLQVAFGAYIEEAIESALEAPAYRASIVRPVGHADHLEAG